MQAAADCVIISDILYYKVNAMGRSIKCKKQDPYFVPETDVNITDGICTVQSF